MPAPRCAWAYGEDPCAVVTSIGPGALQAMAASLAAASNGVGVYHIYGDETTWRRLQHAAGAEAEEQGLYRPDDGADGASYVLHTPEALRDALRRGSQCVHHPIKPGPFYLLLPINTQPQQVVAQLHRRPARGGLPAPSHRGGRPRPSRRRRRLRQATSASRSRRWRWPRFPPGRCHSRAGRALRRRRAALAGIDRRAARRHRRTCMSAAQGLDQRQPRDGNATLLLAIGTRAVCQSDCSGIGYPKVEQVINVNADLADLAHYNQRR
jgi:3D-(3,5/4)-trihydroxycyclohexane-1,2-dione acylhydrolase (decyclizing)